MIGGVESPQTGIQVIKLPIKEYEIGESFRIYIISDVHFGSTSTHLPFIFKKLDKAIAKDNVRIILNGDLFDGIFPKDPRYDAELTVDNVKSIDMADVTVEYVYELMKKYWKYVDLISWGNHERSVIKHSNTDLVQRLIRRVQLYQGHTIHHGYDMGYMVQPFKYAKGNTSRTFSLFYSHGTTNSAPVTKGVIEFNRVLESVTDADVIALGHNHMASVHPVPRVMLNGRNDAVNMIETMCIRTGSFKVLKKNSWEASRNFKITPIGGAMVEITFSTQETYETQVII